LLCAADIYESSLKRLAMWKPALHVRVTLQAQSLKRASASRYKVDHQHYERNNQEQVNEAAGNVKAEAEKPEDQKDYKNRPKHTCSLVHLLHVLQACSSLGFLIRGIERPPVKVE
jgi:hypothetical protein